MKCRNEFRRALRWRRRRIARCSVKQSAASFYSQPQEKRELFIRRYWYLDSISALAESFGFSESKVKVTLSRLRAQLKKHLESEGYSV